MAFIKIHNNRQGVGSSPVTSDLIINIDEAQTITHGAPWTLPDFEMLVDGATFGCAVDISVHPGAITDADIYATLNTIIEKAAADPYHIPVLSGITQQSTGAEFPIVAFDTTP
jgi:hypothetical protein